MFEQILKKHYVRYRQDGFSITSFIRKAQDLAGEHPVVVRALKELPSICQDPENFDRNQLRRAYELEAVSASSAILFTFWWGGLNHQFNAPKLYQPSVLDKLDQMANLVLADLLQLSSTYEVNECKEKLSQLYQRFKHPVGEYKLAGINTSFFTKIFQFGTVCYGLDEDKVPVPIIADKWTMLGVYADMVNVGVDPSKRDPIFNPPNAQGNITFRGGAASEFERYWRFLTYVHKRVQRLRKSIPKLKTARMEELMFGWPRDIENPDNPRHIAREIINTHTPTTSMTFQELLEAIGDHRLSIANLGQWQKPEDERDTFFDIFLEDGEVLIKPQAGTTTYSVTEQRWDVVRNRFETAGDESQMMVSFYANHQGDTNRNLDPYLAAVIYYFKQTNQ